MERERLPLIRPAQPLWVKAAWISAAAAFVTFGSLKMSGSVLPECNSTAAQSGLSEVLKGANIEPTSVGDVKALSTSKDEIACSASVAKNDGDKVEIEYLITLDGKAPKVQITRGEDKLTAAAEAETSASAKLASDDKANCAHAEDRDQRIAACGALIENSAEPAETRAEAYLQRGDAYFANSDYDRAISDYNEAIALGPKNGAAFNKRGAAFAAKGDHAKAIASFSEAIRLNSNDAAAYDNRGCGQVRAGALAKAEKDFKKAKKLGRETPGSQCQIALKELRSKPGKHAN